MGRKVLSGKGQEVTVQCTVNSLYKGTPRSNMTQQQPSLHSENDFYNRK